MPALDDLVRAYNRLDETLREFVGASQERRFSKVLGQAVRSSERLGEDDEDWIEILAEIRNAVVHGRHWPLDDTERISYPVTATEDAIDKIDNLIEALEHEPRTLMEIASRNPEVFSINTSLAELLRFMGRHDYSQVIIRHEGELTLLTSEGIARWFELNLTEDGSLLMTDETATEALEHDLPGHHKVWGRDRLIADAHTIFEQHVADGQPRLFAILLTENGRRDESPLGIVTPWDLF